MTARGEGSAEALAHVAAHGAPDVLCVWGLGVDGALMEACAGAVTIYNSIDAPALRLPDDVARRFDQRVREERTPAGPTSYEIGSDQDPDRDPDPDDGRAD